MWLTIFIATIGGDEVRTPFRYTWLPFADAGFELVVLGDDGISVSQAGSDIEARDEYITVLKGDL